jgi:NADPH-dependent FMN reductase
MRVLGISGSLRRDSYNTALLRHAGALFEAAGAEFEIYHELRDIPQYAARQAWWPALRRRQGAETLLMKPPDQRPRRSRERTASWVWIHGLFRRSHECRSSRMSGRLPSLKIRMLTLAHLGERRRVLQVLCRYGTPVSAGMQLRDH